MPFLPFIPLAATEGPGLEVVFWIVAAAFWLIGQIATARRRKQQPRDRRETPPGQESAPPAAGASPAPDELAEIFRRLGADIPATPPPAPPAPPRPTYGSPSPATSPSRRKERRPRTDRVHPDLAQRLARARQEADEAERLAAAALPPAVPDSVGVQSRRDDHSAISTATRTSGLILPRLYSMGLRLSPLPALPMPGTDRTHHQAPPRRIRLHSAPELRDAVIAQVLLHPPKSQLPM